MKWRELELGELMPRSAGSVNPARHPTEVFDLYSVPAYDSASPDVVSGSQIGSTKQVVMPGDVLLSKIVPHIRRAWVVGEKGRHRQIASSEWIVFRGNDLFPDYFRHFLVSDQFHARLMQTVSGVGGSLLRARPAHLRSLAITLPPLPEQKRIAALLDKADAIRRKRAKTITVSDEFLKSTFLHMFGDPVENLKGWDREPLGKHLARIESGSSPKCLGRVATESEWGILKLGAVTPCTYHPEQNKALPESVIPTARDEVQPGDLLFSRKNTYDLVGASAFVFETPKHRLLPDLIFRLVLREQGRLLPEYLWGLLTTKGKRAQIKRLAGGAAGSMPNISKARLATLDIEIPDIDLQKKYRSILWQAHRIGKRHQVAETQNTCLFNALSQKAFQGGL